MIIRDKESYRLNIILAVVLALSIPFTMETSSIAYIKVIICCVTFSLIFLILQRSSGLELNFKTKEYRYYSRFFGNIKGQWLSLSHYTSVVVLSKTGTKSATGTGMTGSLKVKQGFYELYLMDSNHLKRLFILNTKKKKEIDKMIVLMKSNFNVSLEKYNPITKKRR